MLIDQRVLWFIQGYKACQQSNYSDVESEGQNLLNSERKSG